MTSELQITSQFILIQQFLQMTQILRFSEEQKAELEQLDFENSRSISKLKRESSIEERKNLTQIIKKYRIQKYVNTFRQKIKRHSIYRTPPKFQLAVKDQSSSSFLHIEGVEIKNKSFQSLIFAADIMFSLIVFYISVFQAFLDNFRQQQSSSAAIVTLKILAVAFELTKLVMKSIKKDIVNGKFLKYIDQIIWYSTGLFDLILYSIAICMIILSIVYSESYEVSIFAFFIATIKLFKIPINLKILDMHYINSNTRQSYWNLIKVIIFQLIFMHFVAGILLAATHLDSTTNWLIVKGLQAESWYVQYIWGMYWSATLITTTGFGDFIATNTNQAIVVAALELFSSVVLAYNLNLIGSIVLSLRNAEQFTWTRIGVFTRMTNEASVAPQVEKKIFNYFDYQRQVQEKFEFKERTAFLKQLPEQLRAQYESDVNQLIFRQLPYFCNLRLDTLNSLAPLFFTKVYYPGESLISSKEDLKTIMILKRGQVSFLFRRPGAKVMNGTLVDNFRTGEASNAKPILINSTFISRTREVNYDIIAKDYSLVMALPQAKFMEEIRKSEIQKQHYFTIYDKHDNTCTFGASVCQYCPETFHNKFQCPKLHYFPFKTQVVIKYLLQANKNQPRQAKFLLKQRKEHCYYLRANYYQAYESYKNISTKQTVNSKMSEKIEIVKKLSQQFNQHDILLSFQQICKKIEADYKQKPNQPLEKLQVDALHNYLSYFTEDNPKELSGRRIKRKKRTKNKNKDLKLIMKKIMLAASSKKLIYRHQKDDLQERPQEK